MRGLLIQQVLQWSPKASRFARCPHRALSLEEGMLARFPVYSDKQNTCAHRIAWRTGWGWNGERALATEA